MILVGLAFAAFAFNVWAGRLRARSRKLSVPWFVWIHLPVVAIVPMRWWLGLEAWSIPILIAASVAGQLVGGRLDRNTAKHKGIT